MFRYTISFVAGVCVAQEYKIPPVKPVINEYRLQLEKWLNENKK
jgi:hypothetical protein